MPTIFRCRICSEACLLDYRPSHCPFCGAHERWMIDSYNYVRPKNPELTDISLKNLTFTYNLEIKASQIYHCVRKKTEDEYISGMFKTIAKVELEHAEIVGKLINKNPGCEIFFDDNLCTEDKNESLNKAKILEDHAISHYKKFLKQSTEPRVKEIFQALIEAEQDHHNLFTATL